ncbi:hypothetical protein [Silvibacterium sp.]|uniref:hypothetical protein n=1 Tax=Silvibacterium sp. TaxID=1964179 RepID=UPI0039E45F37
MPKPQKIVRGKGELHLVSCNCFLREPKLGQEKHRDLFCQLLEQLRHKFRFRILGYVVMPTGFHLLLSTPENETTEETIATLRQRYQRRYNTSARTDDPAWDKAITVKHIVSPDQIVSAVRFMNEAPVKANLVETETDWEWSSARSYAGLPEGVVTVEVYEGAKAAV